jgi:NO-binding membrane sensor protein with MHYT domain
MRTHHPIWLCLAIVICVLAGFAFYRIIEYNQDKRDKAVHALDVAMHDYTSP